MSKITKQLSDMINDQINAELESAYLYLDMANYYASKSLGGFQNNFEKQAEEEVEHAFKLRKYLIDNSIDVVLKDVKITKVNYKDLREPLQKQLEHEEFVTSLIYKLMDKAIEDRDYATIEMLKWFVSEQQEEEISAKALLDEFDAFASDKALLYKLNSRLGKRE